MRNYEPSLAFSVALIATLLGGGSIAAMPFTSIPDPVSMSDDKTLVLGPNLPDGVAFRGETDHHNIAVGFQETCALEAWTLPLEYQSVGEFVAEHPGAQPDLVAPADTPDEWYLCADNEDIEHLSLGDQWVSLHEGITGVKARMEADDLLA